MILILGLAITLALPSLWIASECRWSAAARILLGVCTCAWAAGVSCVLTETVCTFNYNAWYGGATGRLIHAAVEATEDGKSEKVLKILRHLDREYHPGYENKGNYRELAEEAALEIASPEESRPGSRWDSSPISKEIWIGHWEDDGGSWLVIDEITGWSIVQSSGPPRIEGATLSTDSKQLRFTGNNQMDHTLTLINKYEAIHEWRESSSGKLWRTERAHKLVRTPPERRAVTEAELSKRPDGSTEQ